MLPIPAINYIPRMFKDYPDDAIVALTDKMDTHIEEWRDEITAMPRLYLPDMCPEPYIEELGYMVGANIYEQDTEREKRIKIVNAIDTHRLRGTWEDHAKIIIDEITGGLDSRLKADSASISAEVFTTNFAVNSELTVARVYTTGERVQVSTTNTLPAPLAAVTDYWVIYVTATTIKLALTKADAHNGVEITLLSDGVGVHTITLYSTPAVTYIDCHFGINVPTLTAAQIASIKAQLIYDVVPCYFYIYYGYIDGSSVFQLYDSIV